MFLVSSCSCLRFVHWSHVLSWEWRCSWSSADRRCSNYIWVITNCIAYKGATYIRGLTVVYIRVPQRIKQTNSNEFKTPANQISSLDSSRLVPARQLQQKDVFISYSYDMKSIILFALESHTTRHLNLKLIRPKTGFFVGFSESTKFVKSRAKEHVLWIYASLPHRLD